MKSFVVAFMLCIALLFSSSMLHASESEVLLKILMKKGIINEQEYREVMQELKGAGSLDERVDKVEEKTEAIAKQQEQGASIPEWVYNISINGDITGVAQGTEGNDDNNPPGKNTTDASLRSDLEVTAPIAENGLAFVNLRAGIGKGLADDEQVLSFHGIDGVAGDSEHRFEVNEAWYEHSFFDEKVFLTVGKIDLTVYYDANEVANDEELQFLSNSFINNIAVEFPDNTLGARLGFSPHELIDIGFGWQTGDGDWEHIGTDPFLIGEIAVKPVIFGLQGNYRFYGWTNKTDHDIYEDVDNTDSSLAASYYKSKRDETRQEDVNKYIDNDAWGAGASMDQQVTPAVTLFSRVGYQDQDIYAYDFAWSAGFDVKGSYWSRDDDNFGFAYGMAHLSSDYDKYLRANGVNPDDEKHLEAYYRVQINDQLSISPDIQYLADAEGNSDFDEIWIFGLRGRVAF